MPKHEHALTFWEEGMLMRDPLKAQGSKGGDKLGEGASVGLAAERPWLPMNGLNIMLALSFGFP